MIYQYTCKIFFYKTGKIFIFGCIMSFNKQQKVKKLKERATNIFTTFFLITNGVIITNFFLYFKKKIKKGNYPLIIFENLSKIALTILASGPSKKERAMSTYSLIIIGVSKSGLAKNSAIPERNKQSIVNSNRSY